MIDRETKESGLDSIKVSISESHYVHIAMTKELNSKKEKTCVWLREGDPYENPCAVSMFVINQLKNDLYLMAYGGAGDAVFDSFGTYRECLERAIATFKNQIGSAA